MISPSRFILAWVITVLRRICSKALRHILEIKLVIFFCWEVLRVFTIPGSVYSWWLPEWSLKLLRKKIIACCLRSIISLIWESKFEKQSYLWHISTRAFMQMPFKHIVFQTHRITLNLWKQQGYLFHGNRGTQKVVYRKYRNYNLLVKSSVTVLQGVFENIFVLSCQAPNFIPFSQKSHFSCVWKLLLSI